MELTAYKDLIKQIPYREHSFETKKEVWEGYQHNGHFGQFYNETFNTDPTITISRGDVFNIASKDATSGIFSTILWGYPKGYTRGNNMDILFPLFLEQVEYLSNLLSTKKHITTGEMEQVLKTCKGIGLSTLSKLLYFFNVKLESHGCLIFDTRIIGVLNNNQFTEFNSLVNIREHNKERFYPDYLKICAELSAKHGYKPDQLELFLFLFGNNLKNQ
ncbi:hypothetical protein SAMN05444410_102243 [Hydrobacter penzbergensis]|uniref:Uncharacterized protein n=1 Tax=Hydrobacter penzbergensis TaxID=1235997 RepID=A0A8X8IDY4_9BACT|nr:hypothetical protein [Hydrobacter penzbergensis]SDW41387.1 hypothetical protein SAMN05444410_102243 [Hydrobacter penzbergensis]